MLPKHVAKVLLSGRDHQQRQEAVNATYVINANAYEEEYSEDEEEKKEGCRKSERQKEEKTKGGSGEGGPRLSLIHI